MHALAPARVDLARLVPSTRSVVAGVALLLTGMAAFAIARQSSIFAIRDVQVVGAQPSLERKVREALAPLIGTSLVALDGAEVQRRLQALPQIRSATYDRSFPNTLRSSSSRTARRRPAQRPRPLARLRARRRAQAAAQAVPLTLPSIWVSRDTIRQGRAALPSTVDTALRGLAAARRSRSALLPEIRKVRAVAGELTLRPAVARRAPARQRPRRCAQAGRRRPRPGDAQPRGTAAIATSTSPFRRGP